jgi:hypothetical protein
MSFRLVAGMELEELDDVGCWLKRMMNVELEIERGCIPLGVGYCHIYHCVEN